MSRSKKQQIKCEQEQPLECQGKDDIAPGRGVLQRPEMRKVKLHL